VRVSQLTAFQVVLFLLVVAAMGGGGAHLVELAFGRHAAVAGAVLAPLVLGPLLSALAREPISLLSLVACSVASLLGYFTPQTIEWLFARAASQETPSK
jgi:hypothetical protein